jgi:large subunit ribosomal protein L23
MHSIIVKPHITEKAGVLAENGNIYTFVVSKASTKTTIAAAIKELYKVTPIKVAITTKPAKQVITRGKAGVRAGMKKAYVYLKKGDKIEFI